MTTMRIRPAVLAAASVAASFFGFAAAAHASDGLVKGSGAAVYYVDADKRYVFPNENVYASWYADFSGVRTISDEELASYQLGGNVTYKPGSALVKLQSDPKVYAVGAGGELRWIASEEAALALYGEGWNRNVVDIPDSDFFNYRVGAPVEEAADFDRASEASVPGIGDDLARRFGIAAPPPPETPAADATGTAAVTVDPWGSPFAPPPVATSDLDAGGPSIVAATARARQMILDRMAAEKLAHPKNDVVTRYDIWVEVTLAIWNSRTDEIKLVEARKNGTGLKIDTPEAGLAVSVRRTNGVNSSFAVDGGGENVVLAVRYPIFKDISTSSRSPKYELVDVLYTPYSPDIHQTEMVEWGKKTLRSEIGAAYDQYRAAGIKSKAFPDRLLVDVIDPQLVESIALIEHLGVDALLGDDATKAMESVYVVVGANQKDAYDYSRSSAGALGMVQFIPSTYALMAKRTDLGLIKDFETGMSDPVNAFKAEIAYLDAELATMPLAVKDLYYVDNDRVKEYLSAAYNAGGTRVRRAIVQWGDGWSDPHAEEIAAIARKYGPNSATTLKVKNATLHKETIMYVKKLRQALKILRPPPPLLT